MLLLKVRPVANTSWVINPPVVRLTPLLLFKVNKPVLLLKVRPVANTSLPTTTFPFKSIPKLFRDVVDPTVSTFNCGTYTVFDWVPITFCPPKTTVPEPVAELHKPTTKEYGPVAVFLYPPGIDE